MKAMQDIGAADAAFSGISVGKCGEDGTKVVEEIEKAIRARCEKVNLTRASQLYNVLWDTLFRDPVIFQNGPVYASQGFLVSQIFTTNYDLAFDSFLRKRRIPFSDGFEPDSVNDFVFTGQWKGGTAFHKLHGSIDYFIREDNEIVRLEAAVEDSDRYGRQIESRVMIYPAWERYAKRRPFYEEMGGIRPAPENVISC